MADGLVQIGIALFGLTALWWAMGNQPRLRRWAPVVGLVGQVFWFSFAWLAHRQGVDVRGLVVLCVAYSFVYVRGIFVQRRPASTNDVMAMVYLFGAHRAEHPEDEAGASDRLAAIKNALGVAPARTNALWHRIRRAFWRWSAKRYQPGFHIPGRCADCGIPLTYAECTYYGRTCERCEGIAFHAQQAAELPTCADTGAARSEGST